MKYMIPFLLLVGCGDDAAKSPCEQAMAEYRNDNQAVIESANGKQVEDVDQFLGFHKNVLGCHYKENVRYHYIGVQKSTVCGVILITGDPIVTNVEIFEK